MTLADHALDDPGLVDLWRHRRRHHLAAVAEDGDLVGDRQHILEEMRNEDETVAVVAQFAQGAKQTLDLGRRQRRGRLVKNDDAGARKQHARKLDKLLDADRQLAQHDLGIELEAQLLELLARALGHGRPVDGAQPVDGLNTQIDVLGHRQLRHDAQFLMHHADAVPQRIAGGMEMHRLAVEQHLAIEAGMDAGDDLHQGRFAGAVLADECVDLAAAQGEIHTSKRFDTAEGLRDVGHFQPYIGVTHLRSTSTSL